MSEGERETGVERVECKFMMYIEHRALRGFDQMVCEMENLLVISTLIAVFELARIINVFF